MAKIGRAVPDMCSGQIQTHHNNMLLVGGVVVSGVRRMNEVNPCRARLVLGWVTVFGRVYHLGM